MKEIIYIQAGSLANYVGTHFWNTQERYFTFGDEKPIVNTEISFREGLSSGESILNPRLLAFDRKDNFGTLSPVNSSEHRTDGTVVEAPLWDGNIQRYAQSSIPRSEYHKFLDERDIEDQDEPMDMDGLDIKEIEVRYWSDFSRLYFASKSIQALHDPTDETIGKEEWNLGRKLFQRFDEETSLMEGSFRFFVEECDTFQGLQLIHDLTTFGSFIDAFLTSFREEFSKAPILAFPILSDVALEHIDADDAQTMKQAIHDALCLRSLNELSDMNILLQHPSLWPRSTWEPGLEFDHEKMYHTSALLSAHLETSTLPIRMADGSDDLARVCTNSSWTGHCRFGQMSGISAVSSSMNEDNFKLMFNFSLGKSLKSYDTTYARRDVSRGFSPSLSQTYDSCVRGRFLSQVHAPPYPLPTSFPPIFTQSRPHLKSTTLFSSLSFGTNYMDLFANYAHLVEDCVKVRRGMLPDLEIDDMKELSNDLWSIRDGFDIYDASMSDADNVLSEDEE